MKAAARVLLVVASIPLLGIVHALAALGIRFAHWPASDSFRTVLALLYAGVVALALLRSKRYWRTAAISLAAPACIWLSYGLVDPKTDGEYPPATARAATVAFDGSTFTLHGVRNFEYRSETDFDVHWEDRTYDLSKVRTVDYVVCWWTEGQQIAHTMNSFGFEDGRYLCCSIEIRREKDELYGPIDGLFRRYELIYVWGDERDLIRLRTNHRKEEVRLYRTTFGATDARLLLADYLETTNAIAAQPAFYNTITRNCTSSIGDHINRVLPRKIAWYQRRLRNGFTDRRGFEGGWIADGEHRGFDELRQAAWINERAQAADAAEDFSARIRTHLTDGRVSREPDQGRKR